MSILCATKSLSQTQAFYPVQRLNLSDSIVNEHITCIAEDDKGQLWLGTTQGLFQYNGKNLKRFTFDARNPNSISGNHILSLHFDSVHKALWIGTNGNGMSKFDLTTEKITRFRIENGTQILHKDNAYWSIKKINSKQLVLASAGGGIKVFDIDKEAFNKEKLYSNLPKSDVRCIANGPLGVFWVGTFQDGLCYLNTKSNTCISFPKLKALGLNQILSLYYDEQQEILWIGTQFNGLWKYSKQKNSFQKVLDLPKERILSLEIRTKYPNEVWMSSSSGIKLYNTKHQQLYDEPLLKTQENIDLSKITSLFKDKRENLWFGVLNQGLYGIPPGLAPIVNSKALGIKIKGKVIDIENWGDSLLILTDSNQLILKNTQNNSLSYLKAPESSPRFLFKETQNNHVFIGTKEGLFQLNTQSSKFTRIELPFPKELSKKISLSCGLKDSRGVLWLGTDSSGLFRFSPETTLLNQFKPSISLNSLSDSAINLIYEDTQGRVWIGTKNNGLALFNRFAETFIRVPDFKGTVLDFKDLGDNIYTIVSDKALLTFHYDGTTFSTIEQLQAEHIKSPKAIQYYNSAIWVSDATGLYAIKFENNGFNKVQKVGHNLIQQLRFTSGSSYKLNKELLFGAEQDLILFNPDSIGFTRIFYPVVLEGLSVNNQAVKIQESNKTSFRFDRDSGSIRYPYLDTLQFLFGTENIGLSFASTDFMSPDSLIEIFITSQKDTIHSFREKLSDVFYLPELSPDQYTIHVRPEGSALDKAYSITLIIIPLWWQTWLFRIIVLIAICWFMYTGIRYIIEIQTRELKIIQRKAKLRQQFLHRQSPAVLEKVLALIEMMKHNEQLETLKQAMSHMIVHDLDNPLQQEIINDAQKQGNTLEENQSAISLIVTLLNITDTEKIAAKNYPISKQKFELNETIRKAIHFIEPLAQHKKIGINLISSRIFEIEADPHLFERIFYNLLMNAITHSTHGSRIEVELKLHGTQEVRVEVRDFGSGMDDKQLQKVLHTRAFNKKTDAESKSLGLHFTALVLEQHHSKLQAMSTKNQGSTFYFILPVVKTEVDYSASEHIKIKPVDEYELEGLEITDHMQQIARQLNNTKVNEASKILAIIGQSEIDETNEQRWIQYIKQTIYAVNQTNYRKLLDIALNKNL